MQTEFSDRQIIDTIDDEYIEEAARFAADHEQERKRRKNRRKKAVISVVAAGLMSGAVLLICLFYHSNGAFHSPAAESELAGRDRSDTISEVITAESQKMEELPTSDNKKPIIKNYIIIPYEEEISTLEEGDKR